jgi:hypothetical protein
MPTTAEPRLHVVRALLFGVLAEVFTIITVILVIYGHRFMSGGQTDQQLQEYGLRAAAVVGPVFGVIYTFLMALWVARKVEDRAMTHGLLVAVGAAALHVVGAFGAPGGFRAIYAVADLLKLAAGAAAGFLGGRPSPSSVSA